MYFLNNLFLSRTHFIPKRRFRRYNFLEIKTKKVCKRDVEKGRQQKRFFSVHKVLSFFYRWKLPTARTPVLIVDVVIKAFSVFLFSRLLFTPQGELKVDSYPRSFCPGQTELLLPQTEAQHMFSVRLYSN